MLQLKYGKPSGLKEKVLAIIGDTFHQKDLLNLLGFKWNPINQYWAKKEFNSHTVDAINLWDNVEVSEAVWDEYHSRSKFSRPERKYQNLMKSSMLLDYQSESLDFLRRSGNSLCALSIGLGKTPTAIAYAEELGLQTLIVCPASLKEQWYNELTKFTDSPESNRIIMEGSDRSWDDAENYQYCIASYDLLKQKFEKLENDRRRPIYSEDMEKAKVFVKGGLLLFDEIMRIKSRKADRTIGAKTIREQAAFCVGLTGTPIENNLGEFYNILDIISPGFMPSYEKFAEMFLVRELKSTYGGRSFWVIQGEKNLDQFTKLVSPLYIRKEKRQCLELPPSSTVVRKIALSKKQKENEKRLLQLSRENPNEILKYFTYARENVISPSIVPGQVFLPSRSGLDLWTEHEGFIPSQIDQVMDGTLDKKFLDLTPRIQEVKDIIEETGKEKLIIFSTYVKALNLVAQLCLSEPYAMVAGDCDVEEELAKFRGNKVRILLASSKAEEGLNLQNANLLLCINSEFNPAKMRQLEGRIERKGQENPMTFYKLISDSVVEKRIEEILKRKEKLSERVLAQKVMGGERDDK
jgi:SNF2 family DNA or RNA helicase